jgi:hypothetical protein
MKCPDCEGGGIRGDLESINPEDCETCKGTGEVPDVGDDVKVMGRCITEALIGPYPPSKVPDQRKTHAEIADAFKPREREDVKVPDPKWTVPDCQKCGKKMEHIEIDDNDCVHWFCEECKTWNWPAELDEEDNCPVCYPHHQVDKMVEGKCPYCGGPNHKKCPGPEKAQEDHVAHERDWREEVKDVLKYLNDAGLVKPYFTMLGLLDEINRLRKFDEGKALTIRALEIAQDEFKKENESLRAKCEKCPGKHLTYGHIDVDKYYKEGE